ncbi:MAG: hypothetical protein ABGZ17_11395, partial [Planctomycetaceae bacterium]
CARNGNRRGMDVGLCGGTVDHGQSEGKKKGMFKRLVGERRDSAPVRFDDRQLSLAGHRP